MVFAELANQEGPDSFRILADAVHSLSFGLTDVGAIEDQFFKGDREVSQDVPVVLRQDEVGTGIRRSFESNGFVGISEKAFYVGIAGTGKRREELDQRRLIKLF